MADLFNFCLKLEAMHKPLFADLPESTEPPDPSLVLVLAEWLEDPDSNGGRFDEYRPQMLREMRITRHQENGALWAIPPEGVRLGHNSVILWRLHPYGEYPAEEFSTQADAARELIRRAFELMTMPCPHSDMMFHGCQELNHDFCSGRGWVPAWTKECGKCGGRGRIVDSGPYGYDVTRTKCPDCRGQKWVKVPERAVHV